MKILAKNRVCNHFAIGEKTFKNILMGPGKLRGLSRNGPLAVLPSIRRKLVRVTGAYITYSFRTVNRKTLMHYNSNETQVTLKKLQVAFSRCFSF